MSEGDSTCWTVIEGAAAGRTSASEAFARRYEPVVRAYLVARWRPGPLLQEVEDAVQDVFVDCFRDDGALARVDPAKGVSFRAFLYGVVRNVARRVEREKARSRVRPAGRGSVADRRVAEQDGLSSIFERAWAEALVREAGTRMAARARETGDDAEQRIELLQLRFGEGLPIRSIAAGWQMDPARVHHAYAKARDEFREALEAAIRFHQPTALPGQIRRECIRILQALG